MNLDLGSRTTQVGSGDQSKSYATCLAVDRFTGEIVAFGDEAEKLSERTATNTKVVRPVAKGVITDLDLAAKYLQLVWTDLGRWNRLKRGPLKVVTSTNLSRLGQNILAEAVAVSRKKPHFVLGGLASSTEGETDINSTSARAVINLGAETTEAAVFGSGRVLRSEFTPIGADELTRAIQVGISNDFGADIPWFLAEQTKRSFADIDPSQETGTSTDVVARDRLSGLPVSLTVKSSDIENWFQPYLSRLRTLLCQVFSDLPPQVADDLLQKGVLLTGGGALQRGIEEFVTSTIGIDARVAANPIESAVLGAEKL